MQEVLVTSKGNSDVYLITNKKIRTTRVIPIAV